MQLKQENVVKTGECSGNRKMQLKQENVVDTGKCRNKIILRIRENFEETVDFSVKQEEQMIHLKCPR